MPSVTQLTGQLNKPALIPWANREGLAGRRVTDIQQATAKIGTEIHELCIGVLLGHATQGVPRNLLPALDSFCRWIPMHHIGRVVLAEEQITSEEFRLGGTPDVLLYLDGILSLLDIKTGSGVYDEHRYQAGSYTQLLRYAGHPVMRAILLHVPRDGDPVIPHELTEDEVQRGWQITLHLRDIYNLRGGLSA